MTDLKVQPKALTSEKTTTCGTIAADLRRLADSLDAVADLEMQVDPYVTIGIQPGGTEQQVALRTDAIGRALFGKPGEPQHMSGGTWHYKVEGRIGVIRFDVYDRISDPKAMERDAELESLRAEVEALRAMTAAEATGLGYSREADDPTPVSPGRPAAHYAAATNGGLVEEPVTWHFSFGYGQHDPDTGEHLIGKYATVIAPTADACREAMFASKYGDRWSFDYAPESSAWLKYSPDWTEHDRIVVRDLDDAENCDGDCGDPACANVPAESMAGGE